jgi:4-hydroxyphenylpyruvate dioxygenase
LVAPVASFQGGILESQGERRAEAWQFFRRRLELCRAIGVQTLVVACDVPPPLSQLVLDRVQVSLQQAAQEAAAGGVRLALEFQASAAFGNNLQTAAALVAEVNSPALGLCLDAYHWHVSPSKADDLGLLTPQNLFHVQFSDLADVPRELATDSQRILPGDGDIRLDLMVAELRRMNYQGLVSLEVLNPQLWQVPAVQFGEIGLTALRKVLGQARH